MFLPLYRTVPDLHRAGKQAALGQRFCSGSGDRSDSECRQRGDTYRGSISALVKLVLWTDKPTRKAGKVGRLNLFNALLSPKTYWRGPRSQEVEGDYRSIYLYIYILYIYIYITLHCHHQNDSCIKMGSDDNNFNVFNCYL